ncbi:DUF4352 domain-containing protein [Spirillospora sp. NPDC050679]
MTITPGTRPTRPDAVRVAEPAPPPAPAGAPARLVRTVGALVGVQAVAALVIVLTLTSYRRAAADWIIPVVGVVDALASLQIVVLALRERRMTRIRPRAPIAPPPGAVPFEPPPDPLPVPDAPFRADPPTRLDTPAQPGASPRAGTPPHPQTPPHADASLRAGAPPHAGASLHANAQPHAGARPLPHATPTPPTPRFAPPLPPPTTPSALRVWLRRLIVLALLGGLAAAAFAVYQERSRPAPGVFGKPVKDGDLTFTAAAPQCGARVKGVTALKGRLCQVRVTVTNTGPAPLVLDATVQRLRAGEAEHTAVALHRGRSAKDLAFSLRSAASFQGAIVFDVPDGFTPTALDLHADADSRGVRFPAGAG